MLSFAEGNFHTVGSPSFHLSFIPCNCWGPFGSASVYYEKLIDFHFQKSPDFGKRRFLVEEKNRLGFMLTSPLCLPPPSPQMKMDRNGSSTKVAVGHTAPGDCILTEVIMPVCPA